MAKAEGPGPAQRGAEAGLGGLTAAPCAWEQLTKKVDGARHFTMVHGWRVRGNRHELKQEVHTGVRKNFTMKMGEQRCPQRLCSLGGLQQPGLIS